MNGFTVYREAINTWGYVTIATYERDDEGNLLKSTSKDLQTGETNVSTYEYDDQGRQTKVVTTYSDGATYTTTIVYDEDYQTETTVSDGYKMISVHKGDGKNYDTKVYNTINGVETLTSEQTSTENEDGSITTTYTNYADGVVTSTTTTVTADTYEDENLVFSSRTSDRKSVV